MQSLWSCKDSSILLFDNIHETEIYQIFYILQIILNIQKKYIEY